jgi:hypothetical protein
MTFYSAACFLLFFPAMQKDYRAAMKRTFILIAVITAAAGARADLVLQQQITTPNYEGVTTMKIKGAKMRMDLYAGQPKAQSIVTDLNTGEILTLIHSEKLFSKTADGPVASSRTTGKTSSAPVARPTGKTQKVGEYDTELYTWSNSRGITGTAWVARNFPDYARIRADLAVLDKTAGADNGTTPELSALPGMVVRSQVTGGGQTITLALISAKETTLDSSLFGIPRDYKELPKLQPVKTVTTQSPPPAKPGSFRTSGSAKSSGPAKAPSSSKASDNSKAPPGNFSTQKAPEW